MQLVASTKARSGSEMVNSSDVVLIEHYPGQQEPAKGTSREKYVNSCCFRTPSRATLTHLVMGGCHYPEWKDHAAASFRVRYTIMMMVVVVVVVMHDPRTLKNLATLWS